MGLITTPLTEIPVNLDATFDHPTWGESGGPFSVPAAQGPGLGSVALASNDFNYNAQHPSRWIRALADRTVLSDEGLMTTCRVRAGVWNIAAGTLNVELTPERIVVDVAQDGGEVFEMYATAGSPEVLGAIQDSYVDISDAGAITVVAVANGAPEPALTPGTVRIYKLVTDATELTDADLVPGIAPFPCLGPLTGIATLIANDVQTVTLSATGLADLKAGCDVGVNLTVGGTTVSTGLTTHNAGIAIPTGQSLALTGSADIAGVNTTIAKIGLVEFLTGSAAPTARQLTADTAAKLIWHDGAALKALHYSPNGWVYATGDQEAITGLAATTLACTTTQTVIGQGLGNVRVIVEGWVQVNSLGSTIDIDVQEDKTADPAFTDIGSAQQILANVTSATTTDWQYFRHERVFNAGTSFATTYKLKVGANGGKTARIRETHLRVVNDEA